MKILSCHTKVLKLAILENIANSRSQYDKILQAHEANTRKYWLEELNENDCIVTRVGVYDEISPEPSGNPSGDITLYTPPLVTIQLQYLYAYLEADIYKFEHFEETHSLFCPPLNIHLTLRTCEKLRINLHNVTDSCG